jgi:octaprenyl-diphosphate synthase
VLVASRLGTRGPDPAQLSDLAAAAELVHAATLLHDDVLDEGDERRGAPTARVLFGNSASVLGGDHLLIAALRRLERTPALLDSMLEAIAQMISAEALQLAHRARSPGALVSAAAAGSLAAEYFQVARGKTAALFGWSIRAGATVGGLPRPALERAAQAGESLGILFQLIDDLLDLAGDPLRTGKGALLDLAGGKLSWPVVHALGVDPKLAFTLFERDPASLSARIRASGAEAATRVEAGRHAAEAIARFRELGDGAASRAFQAIAGALLERSA